MNPNFDRLLGLLDPDLVLSLATVPVLIAVVGGSAIAQTLENLGTMSEEIFRGDQLPRLDFPQNS